MSVLTFTSATYSPGPASVETIEVDAETILVVHGVARNADGAAVGGHRIHRIPLANATNVTYEPGADYMWTDLVVTYAAAPSVSAEIWGNRLEGPYEPSVVVVEGAVARNGSGVLTGRCSRRFPLQDVTAVSFA